MDVIFLRTRNWDDFDGAHRSAQLARAALARGHRVLYVEFQPSHGGARPPNLTLVDCSQLGFTRVAAHRAWLGLDPRVGPEFEARFSGILDCFETPQSERIAIYGDPFAPFVRLFPLLRARGYRLVYDALDDFEALAQLGYYFPSVEAERFLLRECELVTVVSELLLQKFAAFGGGTNIHLLPQGFDPDNFHSPSHASVPPTDLVRGERTLGYWGLVNDFNIDVDLLSDVARARPQWAINLIGSVDADPARAPVAGRLRAQPNIYLLGPKPHALLVDYLAWFDAALVPYPDNPFNHAREPLKVREYLAGHKPVVAAHTGTQAAIPYVYVADNARDFLASTERALSTPVDRAQLDVYLATATWSARLASLLGWVADTPHRRAVPDIEPVAFYRSIEEPENLKLYIAQMEQLLEERTAYISQMEQQWQKRQIYIQKLERTHPLIWLKRVKFARRT